MMEDEKELDLFDTSIESKEAEESSLEPKTIDDTTEEESKEKEDDDQQLGFSYASEIRQELWRREWQGMPEFVQEDLEPIKTLFVHFEDLKDLKEFSKLVDQNITDLTKSIWFPKVDYVKPSHFVYTDEEQ